MSRKPAATALGIPKKFAGKPTLPRAQIIADRQTVKEREDVTFELFERFKTSAQSTVQPDQVYFDAEDNFRGNEAGSGNHPGLLIDVSDLCDFSKLPETIDDPNTNPLEYFPRLSAGLDRLGDAFANQFKVSIPTAELLNSSEDHQEHKLMIAFGFPSCDSHEELAEQFKNPETQAFISRNIRHYCDHRSTDDSIALH